MISIVSLLVAAALVSLQCGLEANAQVSHHKHLDNSLKPNVATPAKQSRHFRKFVLIRSSPGQEVRRVAGQRGVLECEVVGNPAPVAYWMKNGEVLHDDPSEEVNEAFPFSGIADLTTRYIITSTAPGEDEYACVAEAGNKRDVATTIVYTLPTSVEEEELRTLESLFLPSKPVITYHYNSLFSEEGSAALLPCRVQSQATTEVVWQDRDQQRIFGNSRIKVLPSGDLLISSLRWTEDMGNFTCVAENVFGRAEASTFVYPVKP